jgi:hypothetical protein
MQPGGLYWSALEPYADTVSIYDGPGVFDRQYHALPDSVRPLLAGHWCQNEVRNGGFHQFFFNSTGVLGLEAVEAYRTLGMPQLAAVVRDPMSLLGHPYPRERDARQAALEVLGPAQRQQLEQLDERFFEYANAEAGGWEIAADRWVASRAA